MLSTDLEPRDGRRREVVEAAARVLAHDGAGALTLRRVAAEVGGSTQLVYTLFGGKPGLADALYAEGFARLAATFDAALADAPPVGDPERVVSIGRAYCRFARHDTAFFSMMFGRSVPGFTPRRETRRACRDATLGTLVRTADECLRAGTLEATSADALARICWATAHGIAGLLVADLVAVDDATLTQMLTVPVRAHLPATR
ncbi:MAG: WHG domain-containing protein [Nocardioidaceae bacterium]|nr:WHG domain-containing protein [Nocardioidaceae bacterium]